MGRWTQYDEDAYRLPPGMKRVGYDADTQQYIFREGNTLWAGEPCAEYSPLRPVGYAPRRIDADVKAPQSPDLDQDTQAVSIRRRVSRVLIPLRFLAKVIQHQRERSAARATTPPPGSGEHETSRGSEKPLPPLPQDDKEDRRPIDASSAEKKPAIS